MTKRGRPPKLAEPVRVTVFIETADRDRLAKQYGSISAAIQSLVEASR